MNQLFYYAKKQESADFIRICQQLEIANCQLLFEQLSGSFLPRVETLSALVEKEAGQKDILNDPVIRELPIYECEEEILEHIKNSGRFAFITAETGSGKSTILPAIISKYFHKRVVITEPRRIAAISLANYTNSDYIVRFSEELSDKEVVYCTDGSFLANVERFKDYIVIIDEAHERTSMTDLSISYLKEDLSFTKIIITSATECDAFESLWEKPDSSFVNKAARKLRMLETGEGTTSTMSTQISEETEIYYKIPGREYNVQLVYNNEANESFQLFCIEKCEELILEQYLNYNGEKTHKFMLFLEKNKIHYNPIVYHGSEGNFLVFMPGEEEIYNFIEEIEQLLNCLVNFDAIFGKIELFPLHSSLSLDREKDAFLPAKYYNIYVATNIAETSITLPNIVFVIDSCKEKLLYYDPVKHREQLLLQTISKSSEKQRSGRAGREMNGIYFSALTEEKAESLVKSTIPELQRKQTDSVVFAILQLIEQTKLMINVYEWPFVDPPKHSELVASVEELERLKFIDKECNITSYGQEALKLSLDPELAFFLLESEQFSDDALSIASYIASGERPKEYDSYFDDFDWILSQEESKLQRTILMQLKKELSHLENYNGLSLRAVFAVATNNYAIKKGDYYINNFQDKIVCKSQSQYICYNNLYSDGEHIIASIYGNLSFKDYEYLHCGLK